MFVQSTKLGASLADRFAARPRGQVRAVKIAVEKTYSEVRAEARAAREAEDRAMAAMAAKHGLVPVHAIPVRNQFGKRTATPAREQRALNWLADQLFGRTI
jgi:hypothetical protein